VLALPVRDPPEILPVFARKPLWGYRLAVAGMLGVALLSFFVWQHHLFVSGTTRRCARSTLHGGDLDSHRIHLPLRHGDALGRDPLHGADAFALPGSSTFIGGISGVFLSDTLSDVSTHGSFFVMAIFTTIMGGLIFTFFAAITTGAEDDGVPVQRDMAKIHFWSMFIAFNSTFGPLFAAGLLGMPRRVSTYASSLQPLNIWCRCPPSSSVIDAGLPAMSSLACDRPQAGGGEPVDSKSLEWQLPTPVPVHNFDKIPVIDSEPMTTEPHPAAQTREGTRGGTRITMVKLPGRGRQESWPTGRLTSRRRSTSGTSGSAPA
jgi:cytochrome c oxidase subunit 1